MLIVAKSQIVFDIAFKISLVTVISTSLRLLMVRWVVGSIPHGGPSHCSTTGVTCHGIFCSVWGMVHIKEPLLLIGKSSPCGGSWFPLSLSEWSFTICLTPYNLK